MPVKVPETVDVVVSDEDALGVGAGVEVLLPASADGATVDAGAGPDAASDAVTSDC